MPFIIGFVGSVFKLLFMDHIFILLIKPFDTQKIIKTMIYSIVLSFTFPKHSKSPRV